MASFKPEEIKALEAGGNGVSVKLRILGSSIQECAFSNGVTQNSHALAEDSCLYSSFSCCTGGPSHISGQVESQRCAQAY